MPNDSEMKDTQMEAELVRIRKEEHEKTTAEYRSQVAKDRAASDQNELDKIRKQFNYKNAHGQEVNRWDECNRKADEVISAAVNSYNDWRAAMTELISMFGLLNTAMHLSFSEKIRLPIQQKLCNFFLEKIVDNIRDAGNPEIVLPKLMHQVDYSDADGLKIAPLSRSDNGAVDQFQHDAMNPLVERIDKLFEKGIHMWLEDLGYKPDPANKKKFINEDGIELDKVEYERLKADPVDGLDQFLRGHSKLNFSPKPI